MKNIMATKVAIVLALIVITAISWITTDAKYMGVQYLHHLGTLLLVILLASDIIKRRMSMYAFVCVFIFAMIHIVGARYCYSYVPYNEWFAKLGIVVQDLPTGAENVVHANKFDRFVHAAFGVLLFPCLLHICLVWFKQKPLTSIFVAWLLIQTGSMIYETFEWGLSVVMSPSDTEGYNGQQGDMWDAQKDMALAMLGSTIMAIGYAIRYKLFAGTDKNVHSVECG